MKTQATNPVQELEGCAPKLLGFIAWMPIPKDWERRAVPLRGATARPSVLASGSALGSLPSVALSSAQLGGHRTSRAVVGKPTSLERQPGSSGCVQGVANGRWVETEEAFVNGSGSTGRTPWWWHGMGRIQTWIAHSAPVNGAGANYVMWRAA